MTNEALNNLVEKKLPRIEVANLLLFRLPLKDPFETSFGSIDHREIILCTLEASGLRAYGECVADVDPLYSYETNFTAWEILKRYVIPAFASTRSIHDFLRQTGNIRGHPMAKAAAELALWDLLAKAQNVPLYRLWGSERAQIPCGVSVGLQKDNAALLNRIRGYLSEGYRRIKIKIKPGRDRHLLQAIRAELPDIPLMADANAAYTLQDLPLLQSLDEFHLMMVEQPLHYEDIYEHSHVQKVMKTPICLDESIVSSKAAQAAIDLKSCRIINIKTGRVGGHTESIRIHNAAMNHQIPVWCGGMLESGVGRAHNLALASLPNFTYPGDTSAGNRYWDRDIVDPPVIMDSNGFITLQEKPGIGYDVDHDFLNSLVVHRETVLK